MKRNDEMMEVIYERKRKYTESLAEFLGRDIVYYAPGEWSQPAWAENNEIVVIDDVQAITVTGNSHRSIRDEVCREIYGSGAVGRIVTKGVQINEKSSGED